MTHENLESQMASDTKPTTNHEELAATIKLVAGLWLREVDDSTLELLNDQRVVEAWASLGGSIPSGGTSSSETIDQLAADYCQLLIGPKKHLPPVQSVWADQVFQSQAASSTHRFYDLYADYAPPGSIDDHLGCQLHFAGFLLAEAGDPETTTDVLMRFHAKHLTWATRLLMRVSEKSETDFYRGLASVTRRLIDDLVT